MNEQATAIAQDVRSRILEEPEVILEDIDVMRALVSANDRAMGDNIIDLRGIAMERLESRLARLEETHRSVIAAAYENLAGMNQVHRAIMAFLEPLDFDGFLACLDGDVSDILNINGLKLVLESHETQGIDLSEKTVLTLAQPGFIADYIGTSRSNRQVTLRRTTPMCRAIFPDADWMASEACITLDFGPDRLQGMLVMASDDPSHFGPHQGTDLLSFMGGVFERAMRRWLD